MPENRLKTYTFKIFFPKFCFWEIFGDVFGRFLGKRRRGFMRKKNYKGRCEKRKLEKCQGVCKTYDDIQYAYADILQKNKSIKSFKCNVLIDDVYTSDCVCTKSNADIMVRECVKRNLIIKPMTVKMLDISRNYWLRQGVTDWGIVTNAEE